MIFLRIMIALDCNKMGILFADLSVKRKIEKNREKVLRCDSVLQRNPFIKAIPSSTQNKQKSKRKVKAVSTPVDEDAVQGNAKVSFVSNCFRLILQMILIFLIQPFQDESAHGSGVLDLWDEKGNSMCAHVCA